jgi:uncharacterized spore protein YtfJ
LKLNHWETETRTAIGTPLRAGDRLLYPVLKVEVVFSKGILLGLWSIPLAVLVVEPGGDYLIPLYGEDAGPEIAEIAPSLKAMVEEARQNPQ